MNKNNEESVNGVEIAARIIAHMPQEKRENIMAQMCMNDAEKALEVIKEVQKVVKESQQAKTKVENNKKYVDASSLTKNPEKIKDDQYKINFNIYKNCDSETLKSTLAITEPEDIAKVLSILDTESSSKVINSLNNEKRSDVMTIAGSSPKLSTSSVMDAHYRISKTLNRRTISVIK